MTAAGVATTYAAYRGFNEQISPNKIAAIEKPLQKNMAKKQFKIQRETGTRAKRKNILNNPESFIKNNIRMKSGKKK